MTNIHQRRVDELQQRMADADIDLFVFNDPDTIYYLAGYWGYLGMDFDRATLVTVPRQGDPVVVTPAMEAEMARAMTWIADVREWADGLDGEWMQRLADILAAASYDTVAIETYKTHPRVADALRRSAPDAKVVDGTRLIGEMRMIKSAEEIAIMRQAGQVAVAMVEAGHGAIGEGVPEYELALAVIAGGTRKAAEFLAGDDDGALASPTIFNLQIMQSGHHTCMVHRRSTTRRLEHGDPVYFCFCGITNFKQIKLGFDREFFLGEVSDEHARIYEITVAAQRAALVVIRPGVTAEEVHQAAEAVYLEAGIAAGYRTGRGLGYSYLEEPQIKHGDKTVLAPGMALAVDGGITVPGSFGARVGDSIVVTGQGYEVLTEYPRDLMVV